MNGALFLLESVNSLAGRSTSVDQVIFLVATLDIFKAVPCIAVLLGVTHRTFGSLLDPRLTLGRSFVGISAATAAVRLSQEVLPHRIRPVVEPGLDLVQSPVLDPGSMEHLVQSSSFPSDHAALTVGVVAAVMFLNRRAGWWLAAYVVVVVLTPRVYFGYHYVGDIVVGGLVGIVITVACLKVPLGRLQERLHGFVEDHPGVSLAVGFMAFYQVANLFFDARTILDAFGIG